MNFKDIGILAGAAILLALLGANYRVYNSFDEYIGRFIIYWAISLLVLIWLYKQLENKTLMKALGLK